MRVLERTEPTTMNMTKSAAPHAILTPQLPRDVSVKGEASVSSVDKTTETSRGKAMKPTTTKLGRVSTRELKAGALVSCFVFFVLTLVLAPFGIVSWWLPLIGLLSTSGMVYWLRQTALKQQAARAARPVVRTRPAPVKTPMKKSVDVSGEQKAGSTRVVVAKEKVEPIERRSPLVASRPKSHENDEAVFDQAPDTNAVLRAEAEVFKQGWAPVDVPRPTYTMKAKAERDEAAPAETTPVAPQAAPAESMDSRPLAAKYENAPVDEIPFDGMALDEDYDELPAVYRAS